MQFYNEEKNKLNTKIEIYETVCGSYQKGEVKIGSKLLSVDISDTECKRNLGLSGRTDLNDGGMIFVFEKLGNYGFWMKDMNFPIDILWINNEFKITGIEKNVSPDTYPQSFGSKYKAMYVLEASAGYSDKNNIKVGDKIIFSKK